ncbi:MAG: MTH938/NDUFAF3 family protein [Minisyncoccales bacterium]|jgi:hypothetical protein
MPYINSTEFGSITIDNKEYGQVLIIGNSIIERDHSKLNKLFGTSHKIGRWEVEKLLEGNPDFILIGTGQSGVMKVGKEVLNKLNKSGAKIIVDITPKIVEDYNQKTKEGKRVNALIHTTC